MHCVPSSSVILGISEEHDAGVSVVVDGVVVFACNEERFTRKKIQGGFPTLALREAVSFLRSRDLLSAVQYIAVASTVHVPYTRGLWERRPTFLQACIAWLSFFGFQRLFLGTLAGITALRKVHEACFLSWRLRRIKRELIEAGIPDRPLIALDHHSCHASSAYRTSGLERCMAITLDAAGDGYCSRVFLCENGVMKPLHEVPFLHSIANYYLMTTLALGFKDGQEGKVTGLAAHGDPRNRALDFLRQRIAYLPGKLCFRNRGSSLFAEVPLLEKAFHGLSREDVAAAMQMHLEETVIAYIRDCVATFGGHDLPLALAGGVFANVRLNQRIAEAIARPLFVHPHMGDGGLATGAALLRSMHVDPVSKPSELGDVFLGPSIDEDAVPILAKKLGFRCEKSDAIAEDIAALLGEGKIVARVEGRMEYGPRALGHRSILCAASDTAVCERLNGKLRRSDFMPFAPAVLADDAHHYFHFTDAVRVPMRFMTITCDATDRCKKECPAIVHIDGTARPQLVDTASNPDFEEILKAYNARTGIPVLVNTSFNMHEEPIVATIEEAFDVFARAELDALAIGSYVISSL